MEEEQTGQDTDRRAIVESYLEAVKERDLARCVDFHADDAKIHFMSGVFRGRDAIKEWHEDRFKAELEFVRIKKVSVNGDKVILDAVITTKKLRAWRIPKLAGKATFVVQNGKIKETKFSPRMYNPFEGW